MNFKGGQATTSDSMTMICHQTPEHFPTKSINNAMLGGLFNHVQHHLPTSILNSNCRPKLTPNLGPSFIVPKGVPSAARNYSTIDPSQKHDKFRLFGTILLEHKTKTILFTSTRFNKLFLSCPYYSEFSIFLQVQCVCWRLQDYHPSTPCQARKALKLRQGTEATV